MVEKETLEIDLDLSKLESVLMVYGSDCFNGDCTFFVPETVPLKGTLAPSLGDGSFRSETTGTQRSVSRWSGVSKATVRSGSWTSVSATFTGVCGEVTVSGTPAISNSQIIFMKGTTLEEWTVTAP